MYMSLTVCSVSKETSCTGHLVSFFIMRIFGREPQSITGGHDSQGWRILGLCGFGVEICWDRCCWESSSQILSGSHSVIGEGRIRLVK